MAYDFSSLSPADFEDLARDLVGKEIKVRFESFTSGPDGGIDGRNAKGGKKIILQAKHYVRSSFSGLKAAIRRERKAITKLKPSRYILATSQRLTPRNKNALADLLDRYLKNQNDIFGPDDLNGLLRKFPKIEIAHIKLWLSSSAVLQRILQSALNSFTAISRAEIEAKVKVYARNPSFEDAAKLLERNHVLIVSGPPGVGKTTLAEMISYTYIANDWEFNAIRSLDDGFSSIVDTKKQIFFFDDFLGKVALDRRALSSKDSELAKFIKRVGTSKNARFILTTRAYIFEEARRVSEYLSETKFNILKYTLDVGIYTRRIRARILYNHLYVANLPSKHVLHLVRSSLLTKIIDHPNYNPRIIEWMTDTLNLRETSAANYPKAFIAALDDPSKIWDTAFRTHISVACRHLLFSVFFSSEYGVEIEDLQTAFDALHPLLCAKYRVAQDPKDFEESIKVLEGSFVSIANGKVSFINPSVQDYLAKYLQDKALLETIAVASPNMRWAEAVWQQYTAIGNVDPDERAFAKNFVSLARRIGNVDVYRPVRNEPNTRRLYDLSNTSRLNLLFKWWELTEEVSFANSIKVLISSPPGGFESWLDGVSLVELLASLRSREDSYIPSLNDLTEALANAVVDLLKGWIPSDDLVAISDKIEEETDSLPASVIEANYEAIEREIEQAGSIAEETSSESTLEEQISALRKLAGRALISSQKVSRAITLVQQRIDQIREETEEAESPMISRISDKKDNFSDHDLKDLFSTLELFKA